MADGTVKIYEYGPHRPRDSRLADDSLGALIQAYKGSPEWRALAEATRTVYGIYLRDLEEDSEAQVAGITRRQVLALRDAIAEHRGNGAATGFIRAASALFTWAVDREWIDHTPVTKIKALEGGHLPAWSQEHANTALAALDEPYRRAVVLAMHTGQRRGDLIKMTWSDYDGQRIRVIQQKGGGELVIPTHPELRRELDAWKAERTTVTILADPEGHPWIAPRFTERLGRALDKIDGLPSGLGIHGCRKLAAARMAEAGCSANEIAAVTGHVTLGMVQLYTKSADQERLASAAIIRLSKRSDNRQPKRNK